MASNSCYNLKPLNSFCVEARGLDLKQPISQETIDNIKKDVAEHQLVVFRDQGSISGERQVEISRWFGELDSVFYKHPRSPHPDVFRVSNDPSEGCTGVGRTGWHIDGTFRPSPYTHSIYHIQSVPTEGNTDFVSLYETVESLTTDQKKTWDRLFMLSDRREQYIHPLIYLHPVTKRETLCFHLGMTDSFIWDADKPTIRVATSDEYQSIKQDIYNQITREEYSHIYSHKWVPGDFIISDNLAVGHEASPQTQLSTEVVGLRVMHRTTVKGTYKLSKT